MNFTEHNITLDLHQIGSQVFLPMFRGDCKRKIVIHLSEDGRPYDFDAGLKAHFTGQKPDGTFLYNDCEVNEKNSTILYAVTKQTTAAQGMVCCQLRLIDSDGNTISTPSFAIVVTDTVYNDEPITESSSEFLALTKLYTEIQNKLANGEFDGKDGISVTHSFDGTILKMTSASGTTEVDLKGEKGDVGPQGPEGQQGIQGEKGDKGDAGKDAVTDQIYNPESENAQSGKAVAQAVDGSVPKKKMSALGAPFSSVLAVDNFPISTPEGISDVPNADSYQYIDVVPSGVWEDVPNYKGTIPIRDDNGNLFTGTPKNDADCTNKRYVDDLVGDIDLALNELHNYAQALIGGNS